MKSGRTGKRKIRTMRIFKGLENIHSVIDKHQAEWLREQGEEPERPERISVEERIRRSFAEGNGSGKFSADRFMGGHAHDDVKPETETEFVPEEPKAESTESASESETQNEPSVEIVNVIPQKEERHSWLYNEVVKAIHDAAGDTKNTKIIAVFVPVVQNVKEFESLPVDETVTINQPASEDVSGIISEPVEVPTPEPEPQPETEIEPEPEAESVTEEPAPASEGEPEPELPPISEGFDLVPEGSTQPDEELAEAFHTIEEKLDEASQESEAELEPEPQTEQPDEQPEPEAEPEPEIEEAIVIEEPEPAEPEIEPESESESEDMFAVSEGQPLAYDEIGKTEDNEEIELPEPLDDDDIVFDDSVFEEPLAEGEELSAAEDDSDEETIIIEEKEEEVTDADILKKED